MIQAGNVNMNNNTCVAEMNKRPQISGESAETAQHNMKEDNEEMTIITGDVN